MRENRLRALWRDDKTAVNSWLAVPSSFCAEVMAHQGFDSLTIDLQHGIVDYQAMVGMLQAISTTGPIRANLYGGADYPTHANETIVVFAMIETAQALDNLDAILSVEGLDAIYIGPSDLSLALGCKPSFDDPEPKAVEAIEHILARAKAHGVVAGIHNGEAKVAKSRAAMGFRFVTVMSDTRFMVAGAQAAMKVMRG